MRQLTWARGLQPGRPTRAHDTRQPSHVAGGRRVTGRRSVHFHDAGHARPLKAAGTREEGMARYLISFDAHAMDHIPDQEMPAVGEAAHAVAREAMEAGVWVFGGGLENQKAGIVATDGTVADGPYPQAIGGLCIVDVPSREEALEWAARFAGACRCAQEVREFGPDSAVGN